MGRGLLSGLWDVEAAIYVGHPPPEGGGRLDSHRTEAALRAARAEAERNGWAVSIAVVDICGEPLGLVKLDGSAPDSARCAITKAQQAIAAAPCCLAEEEPRENGLPQYRCILGVSSIFVENCCIGAIGVHGIPVINASQIAKKAAEAILRSF